jgi:DNA-binding protein H-NS
VSTLATAVVRSISHRNGCRGIECRDNIDRTQPIKEAGMKTYTAIKAEIARLEKQADALRKTEIAGVIAGVKETLAAYGLTAADLGSSRASARAVPARSTKGRREPSSTAGVARYRDPKTGATWTGRGRPPAWLPAAGQRDRFLIEPPAAKSSGAAAAEAAPAGARKPRAAAKKGAKAQRASTPKAAGRAGKKVSARAKKPATPAGQGETSE